MGTRRSTHMLRTILVLLDGSPICRHALAYTVELERSVRARLVLVRVPRSDLRAHLGRQHAHAATAESLLRQAQELRRDGLEVETVVLADHRPEALLRHIDRWQADLVVLGTARPRLFGRWGRGSIAGTVLGHGGCPVLLLAARSGLAANAPSLVGKRILVPLDGSPFAEAALPTAVQLARALDSELLLLEPVAALHLLPSVLRTGGAAELEAALLLAEREEAASAYLQRVADQLVAQEQSLSVSTIASGGKLLDLLRQLSQDHAGAHIGLVVGSAHPRTGPGGVTLGGIADAVLRQGRLPLVVVRPAEPTAVTATEGGRWAMRRVWLGRWRARSAAI